MKYRKISKAKSNLIREASHEIRGGVNGIIGLTNLLLDDITFKQLPIDIQSLIEGLYSGSRQLKYYLNNILELEKTEAGLYTPIRQEPFSVYEWIADIENVHLNFSRANGIEFIRNIDNDLPSTIIGDRLKLTIIVNNLLFNAFEATGRGKVVSLDTQHSNRELTIVIADQGIGMSSDELKRVFKPFVQFGSQSSKINGTGIGLSLVKKYVHMLKGKIHVVSTPAKGSIFTVTLPFTPAQSDNTLPYKKRKVYGENNPII